MKRVNKTDNGIKQMLFASFLFAVMGAFAKLSSEHMSSLEVVFFRNIFGVFIISYSIYKVPLKQSGGKTFLLFFRGIMGFLALLAYFYNVANIPLGDAMTYSKTAPIFTAIFAWFFLKERLSFLSWMAVFIGFTGIVLIAQPSQMGFTKYDLLGILSGIGAALAYTSIKELRKYYDTRAIVLSFTLVGTVAPLLLFLVSEFFYIKEFDFIFGKFVIPSGVVWFYIIALGVLGTLSQYFMTKAYTQTKAGIIGAISYATIPFSILVGILLGDAMPELITICGIVLIVISGIVVAKQT